MFVRSLAIGVSAAALMVGGAQAADLIIPTTPQPVMESYGFDWEGLYAGVRAGGVFADDVDTQFLLGAAAGVNFIPADPFLVGVEVTADYIFESDDFADYFDVFANVRAGAVLTDSALVYALAGVGFVDSEDSDSEAAYQLGAGVEFAVTDAVTVRGELVGQGLFDDSGDDEFFEAAKATVGVFYHF
jgi:outer membrane immunogenic protein